MAFADITRLIPESIGGLEESTADVSLVGVGDGDNVRLQRANNFLQFVYRKHIARYGAISRAARMLACPRATTDRETAFISLTSTGRVCVFFDLTLVESLYGKHLDCAYIILHEGLHWLFDHFRRCGTRDHHIWNIATDVMINTCLDDIYGSMPNNSTSLLGREKDQRHRLLPGLVYNTLIIFIPSIDKFLARDFIKNGVSAEGVYDAIVEAIKKECCGDMSKMGALARSILDSIDKHWRDYFDQAKRASAAMNQDVMDEIRGRALAGLEGSLTPGGKPHGDGTGNIPVGELAVAYPRAVQADDAWKRCIRRLLSSLPVPCTSLIRSYKRQRKMIPGMAEMSDVAIGSPPVDRLGNGEGPLVAVYIDTSGSMEEKLLVTIAGFVERQMKLADAGYIVFSFDTEIYPSAVSLGQYRSSNRVSLRGRGGTSMAMVTSHANTYSHKGKKLDGVIVITDGYWSSAPITSPKPKYWTVLLVPPDYTMQSASQMQQENKGMSYALLPLEKKG